MPTITKYKNVNTKDDVIIFYGIGESWMDGVFVVCGIIYIIRAIKDKD